MNRKLQLPGICFLLPTYDLKRTEYQVLYKCTCGWLACSILVCVCVCVSVHMNARHLAAFDLTLVGKFSPCGFRVLMPQST